MATFLDVKNGKVHYLKFGRGTQILIAFHGFADNAEMLSPFGKYLGEDYTIFAIDLPFHGKTIWSKNEYAPSDIQEIITSILIKSGCLSYDLLGFSLGGTIILSTLPLLEVPPERVLLLAPGGVKVRGMSSVFPMPLVGRKFFYKVIQRPGWLISSTSFLTKLGVLHSFFIRYFKAHLREPEKRNRLFFTWYALASFPVNIQRVIDFVQKKQIRVLILLGKRDKVIDEGAIQRVFNGKTGFELLRLDSSHQMLSDRVAKVLFEKLTAKGE